MRGASATNLFRLHRSTHKQQGSRTQADVKRVFRRSCCGRRPTLQADSTEASLATTLVQKRTDIFGSWRNYPLRCFLCRTGFSMAVPATDDASFAESHHPPGQAPSNSEQQTLLQQSPSRRFRSNFFMRCCCRWVFQLESWLSVALILQTLIGVARLLTPRPIVAIANFFLAFLGFNPTHSPAVVRLFFLSFFALIVGLSDLFWLVVKFTGPFGSAWLNPEYYWRPLYPSLYENVYVATAARGAVSGAAGRAGVPDGNIPRNGRMQGEDVGKTTPTTSTKLIPLSKILPPEKPPALWRIYVELVCLCVNPVVCLLTSWLAWTLYKRIMAQMHAAEISFFAPADDRLDYGSATTDTGGVRLYGEAGGGESHVPFRMGAASMAVDQSGNVLLQHVHGPPAFVPFAGEGRRLGSEMPKTDNDT